MRLVAQKTVIRLKISLVLVTLFFAVSVLSQNNVPAPVFKSQDPAQVIQFLSRTISWYRQLAVERQLATQPSDLTFVQENRRVADQVVQLAFDYARTQAQLQGKQSAPQQPTPEAESSRQHQGLAQAVQKADQQIQDTQSELQSTREKLAAAAPQKKIALQSQVEELQSELGLLQARRDAIESMLEFVNTSSTGASGIGLRAQIEELARSVPAVLSRAPGTNQGEATVESSSSTNDTVVSKPQPSGIWGLAADLIRLSGKVHTLNDELSATEELERSCKELRAPLVGNLRNLVSQGDQLFAAADVATPAQLLQQKQQLDSLTAKFKQTSAGLLPLSKAGVLLDIYQRTLNNWREAVKDEEHQDLRQLLLRLGVLVVLIAAVLAIGEIWRRTIFRYVHDVRRRYQFLLLRRIVMWFAVGLILVLTFATQLGSAITFAGLLTAGVAVALQNVIVSVVAYFFLIGKYGIRVGDRVQIAGVTGEVVDIGLVRIHLMELGGPSDSQPSGRIVAFSNSIVFQPTAGVFKQVPGTNFVWHELKLTLAAETDYHIAKERITQAVDAALKDYSKSMEAQRRVMERSLNAVSPAELQPKVRLHYTASGIESTVRFPVELEKASETDDHLMQEVMAALGREPKLKLVSAEMPFAKAG
jgi:small-conductance mechanosensitive channel